jgi:uncharacterized membrane protein
MFNIKNYWAPTPKFYRALGDALLTIGTTATAYNIVMDDKFIAMFFLVGSVLGKFITNFFGTTDDGIQQ